MPADRTRGSKRGTTDGALELTWTTPLDATKPASIAFAPNITPGTFNDPPTPVDPPAESMLFPPSGEAPASNKRNAHSKKKPVDHIPRPPNAFILFRSSFIKNQHVSSEVETNHSTLSKIIGLTWQNLPHEERQIWHAKAKAALDEHKKKFPEYAFRPLHTKGKGAADKRKVREVGPKDMERCAAIADLLVQGKKGADLEAAIAEFDKTHVPKIVTRFEAPITARSYRRSSSAPVPDTAHSKPTFLPSPTKSHKPRSSSSEPDGSSRLDAPLDYSTPSSSSSQYDLDTASEYQCDSPASLSVASPSTYIPLTPTNPSLDFHSFSFSSSPAMPLETCDPHHISPQESLYDVYSQTSASSPCSPGDDFYAQSSMSLDASFYDVFNSPTPDSTFNSIPCTPQDFMMSPSCNPLTGVDPDMPTLVERPADYESLGLMTDYSNAPDLYTSSYINQSYCSPSKTDFSSFYAKPDFGGPGDAGIHAHVYLSTIPNFAM